MKQAAILAALPGRQRGNMDMDLPAMAAGRADHPLGPPAAGSLAGAGRAVSLPHRFASSPHGVRSRRGLDGTRRPRKRRPIRSLNWPIRPNNCSAAALPAQIAVAVVMAVMVAPLIEEFFFRVLLQGWLEAVWSRRRRTHPELRAAPLSWLPIVLPAAALRPDAPPFQQGCRLRRRYLADLFLGQMAADLLALGLAIVVLRFAAGATAADLGWKPEKLRADAKLGLLALLAVIGPVLTLQVALMNWSTGRESTTAPDPIPLFFLALVLGVLYHRTHRLAPSLVLHMAFNATSIALLSP